ncbi:MAG: transposase [Bacteroidales bacterium]
MTLTTFKRLYQEYQESGLNIKDFCANQGLAPSTFYYWRNKLEETSQLHRPDNFVPLVFDSNHPATDNQTSQSLIKSSHTSKINTPIELVFPNGTKMVLRDNIDMQLLKTIVHLFD